MLDLTLPVALKAGRGVRDHQLPCYDAQLCALANLNQLTVIFTEYFADGQVLGGVRFANPFAPPFTLQAWV